MCKESFDGVTELQVPYTNVLIYTASSHYVIIRSNTEAINWQFMSMQCQEILMAICVVYDDWVILQVQQVFSERSIQCRSFTDFLTASVFRQQFQLNLLLLIIAQLKLWNYILSPQKAIATANPTAIPLLLSAKHLLVFCQIINAQLFLCNKQKKPLVENFTPFYLIISFDRKKSLVFCIFSRIYFVLEKFLTVGF